MDSIVEMAKLLKMRDNPSIQGVSIGKVITGPPGLKIAVNGFVLKSESLVVAQHLLSTYKRSTNPTISVGIATVGDHGSHTHSVNITDITFTDTLEAGDRVIVVPSVDNMTYFIIDKVGDV